MSTLFIIDVAAARGDETRRVHLMSHYGITRNRESRTVKEPPRTSRGGSWDYPLTQWNPMRESSSHWRARDRRRRRRRAPREKSRREKRTEKKRNDRHDDRDDDDGSRGRGEEAQLDQAGGIQDPTHLQAVRRRRKRCGVHR